MTWLMLDRGFSFAWHTTAVLAFNDAKQVTTCRQFLRSRTMIELGKWREMGLWWVWHGYRRGIRWGMMGYKAWLLHTSSILFPHSHTLNTWSLHMTCHQIFLNLRMFDSGPFQKKSSSTETELLTNHNSIMKPICSTVARKPRLGFSWLAVNHLALRRLER